ncbi:MAG: phosphoribosylformylglycinamidine synthase subunit PurS [Alphaproteobacteria bacterium]|nr:phosphoribosylformylglycinamidine synthase subunit PurS [Alphaproteobacteria bacterium]
MKAKVHVTLKNGVLDPQGKAIETALDHLGFSGVAGVRVGKYIEVDLQGADKKSAQEAVSQMCEKLLANTVVEKYAVEIAE